MGPRSSDLGAEFAILLSFWRADGSILANDLTAARLFTQYCQGGTRVAVGINRSKLSVTYTTTSGLVFTVESQLSILDTDHHLLALRVTPTQILVYLEGREVIKVEAPEGDDGGGDSGDSGELGPELPTDNLSVTLGVGDSLFDGRFGLSAKKPARLRAMESFADDTLVADKCHGDLVLQICTTRVAMTLVGLVTSSSALVGVVEPLLMKPVIDQFGHRGVFVIAAVLAVVSALGVVFIIPESPVRRPGRVDVVGALLVAALALALDAALALAVRVSRPGPAGVAIVTAKPGLRRLR